MKSNLLSLSLFLVMLSCNSVPDKNPVAKESEFINQFKPFLHGVWVQADYMDDLVKTKSPYKSRNKLKFITEFIIDTSGILTDSIEIGAVLGNHEGGKFILYFKQGKMKTSLLIFLPGFEDLANSYELGYEVKSGDTALMIYSYNKSQKLVDKIGYMKVREVSSAGSLENGFQYAVNKKIIAGSYKVTDSAGKEFKVRLNSEGSVAGLPGADTYYITTDFVAESEDSRDKVCFNIQTSEQKCFEFTIDGDTVNFFKESDRLRNKTGEALFKFVKQY